MTVRRGLCTALVVLVLGGIVTTGTSGASRRDRAPRITMTEIVSPGGEEIDFYTSTEIDSHGSVLLRFGHATSGLTAAIWHRGTFTPITPPTDAPGLNAASDLSDHGQVAVGGTNIEPCEGPISPWPWCPRPYLWDDGETTLLPANGLTGSAQLVAKNGSVIVGQLNRYVPGQSFEYELVGWIDGELVKGPEGADRDVIAMNNRGQALISMPVDGETHLAIWQVGEGVTDLGTFGTVTTGVDINDRGDVVGWWNDPETGTFGGFLWRNGEVVDLGAIEPIDVNDRGQVVGTCVDQELARSYGCIWDDGQLTELGNEEVTLIPPMVVNNRGQVIGQADVRGPDGDELHAFLWQRRQLIDLSAAIDFDGPSEALDINDRGQIVGTLGPFKRRYVVWTVHR